MQEFMHTVNWKTTGYGIAYAICKIVGGFFPAVSEVCNVLDTLIVSAGFISSVDASRLQNVVRAVDVIAWKIKIDPATLIPIEPPVVK
jgi:hypothetical protein